jgi:hypothetical protein
VRGLLADFSPQETIKPLTVWWFGLSLVLPIYFGTVSLYTALSHAYTVQDDVRQHVVWLQRFVDPSLFPNDWIADYFETIAPAGYKALYYLIAKLGIEPLLLAKVLPLVLGVIAVIYCFGVALQLLPIPAGAFLTTVILTESLWLQDDIVTATPRAFLYPLFLAFLYYFLKKNRTLCLIAIALQSLFYPQLALVEVGIITCYLLNWQQGRLVFSKIKADYVFWIVASTMTLVLLLVFAPHLSKFGPIVHADQMRIMPEFQVKGRAKFFGLNPFLFWLRGDSGISLPASPSLIWISFLLPLFLRWRLPLAQVVTPKIKLLPAILVASLGLFFLAHLLLLRLYLPNRYTQHSLRILMTLAAGIVLTIALNSVYNWLKRQAKVKWQMLPIAILVYLMTASLVTPIIPKVFLSNNAQIIGKEAQIYQFFAHQPKDILIASLSDEVNSLPTYSGRSVLVGREYVLPYHLGYYTQMRQRAIDLLTAHYSSDQSDLRQFVQKYGIDFFLVDRAAFQPEYIDKSDWLQQFQPAARDAFDDLTQGKSAFLAHPAGQCLAIESQRFFVLKADCIANTPPP